MERQEEAVDETVESWRKDAKIKVYDKVWDTVRMRDIEVTKKEVEDDTEDDIVTEEDVSTENTTTEDTTTEDATTEAPSEENAADTPVENEVVAE